MNADQFTDKVDSLIRMVLSQYRSIKTTDLQYSRVQKKLSKSDMQKIDMVLSKMDVDKSISDHAEEQSKEEGFEKVAWNSTRYKRYTSNLKLHHGLASD